MSQPIEPGPCQPVTSQYLGPTLKRQVRCHVGLDFSALPSVATFRKARGDQAQERSNIWKDSDHSGSWLARIHPANEVNRLLCQAEIRLLFFLKLQVFVSRSG